MRVVTYGDINIDVVLDVDDLPSRGSEVFSTRRRELLGGSAVNTAVVLTRLGFESAVMGAVGDDDAGHRALYQLGSIGVDTDLTAVSQTRHTAMNTILVTPDRERTMIGARGANVTYRARPDWHQGVDWLHLSGYALMEGSQQTGALEVLDTAQREGIPASLDVPVGVGSRISHLVADRLGSLRLVAASRASLEEVTGSASPVETLVEDGTSRVAVTSGADPVTLASPGGEITLTPPAVDVIDTTGAGDAFVAGMVAASLSGFDPGPSALLAAAAGAAATLVPGASNTLADPSIWSDLLATQRWTDADPAWLEKIRTFVAALVERP
jgi:sugar/nucleoside kinase (ribokinase family)